MEALIESIGLLIEGKILPGFVFGNPGRARYHLFGADAHTHSLVAWRWGTLIASLDELEGLEVPLSLFKLEKFKKRRDNSGDDGDVIYGPKDPRGYVTAEDPPSADSKSSTVQSPWAWQG